VVWEGRGREASPYPDFIYYNFAKVHMTLKKTPAMAAGIADHVWSLEEVIGLLETREQAVAA